MNVKLGKKFKSMIAVYAILLVVYMVVFLVIPFPKIGASWISFVFTIISIICSMAVCGYAFSKGETLVSKVYGYPVFRVSVIYLLAQFGIGIIICILGTFLSVPYWVALLISIILLGAASIGVIVTDNTRDLVEEAEEQTKVDTKSVTLFQLNINAIVQQCGNTEVKKELDKLNEQFRYSDPVSSEETREIEVNLEKMLAELSSITGKGNTEEIRNQIRKVSNTLAERNRICKASKK